MVVNAGKDNNLHYTLSKLAGTLDILNSKYGVTPEQALKAVQLITDERGIPLSIFNPALGSLESIVKYFREELFLDYDTIARILYRNAGPIGITYRRTKTKFKGRLDISSEEMLPISVFQNRRLSVFENIAHHLEKNGHDWHEIARILHRDDKTVWTILDRAKRKMRSA